jgi:hypothetical protein
MTVSPSIPGTSTIQMRRSRLVGIVVLVAAVAAVITWALVAYAQNTGNDSVEASTATRAAAPIDPDELALSYGNGRAHRDRCGSDRETPRSRPVPPPVR